MKLKQSQQYFAIKNLINGKVYCSKANNPQLYFEKLLSEAWRSKYREKDETAAEVLQSDMWFYSRKNFKLEIFKEAPLQYRTYKYEMPMNIEYEEKIGVAEQFDDYGRKYYYVQIQCNINKKCYVAMTINPRDYVSGIIRHTQQTTQEYKEHEGIEKHKALLDVQLYGIENFKFKISNVEPNLIMRKYDTIEHLTPPKFDDIELSYLSSQL